MPNIQLQFRRGTSTEWSNANTILADGELAIETNTRNFKIGNGSTVWNSLSYGGILGPQGWQGRTGPTGFQGSTGFQGPQGNQGFQGFQGRTGPTGGTFTTLKVDTGSAVITSPTSINLVTTGDAVGSVEYLNSTSEGIYFQFALPAVTAADTLIVGILDSTGTNPYSVFLTNTNSYELFYITSGTNETGTYTPGDIFSIYLDGSSVFFKLNGITLNAPLSILNGSYKLLIVGDTISQTYAISNIRFYPTGKRGPTGPTGPGSGGSVSITGNTGWGNLLTVATGNTGIFANGNLQFDANTNRLNVIGSLRLGNGYRPLYTRVVTSATIPGTDAYGTHYDINTTLLSNLTVSLPASGQWSNDSNGYWVFRNNTGSYLSLNISYTVAIPNIYPTNIVIPPGNSTTLMATYPGGGTNSNYVLF